MFEFVRVTSAVPKVSVGDPERNAGEICKMIKKAESEKSDIVLFPELCITGYTCADLFFQQTLIEESVKAAEKILKFSEDFHVIAEIGLPLKIGGQLYNCAMTLSRGRVMGITVKTFMPNYNEFYEKRWFSVSEELKIDEVSLREMGFSFDYSVPIGRNLIFNIGNEVRFGVEICEDLWSPLPPSTFAALEGAEIILNLSASNETISKRDYRKNLVLQQSARNICAYIYTSAGNSESTQDLVFSGHTIMALNGAVTAENQSLTADDYTICADIDIGRVKADRLKLKTFKDAAALYAGKDVCRTVYIESDICSDGELLNVNKLPFVPSDKADRLARCRAVFDMQSAGLKKRLEITGGKAVIGVSGGLDSTLALLVCAEAMRRLGRDLSEVVGITMPCFGTTDRTYNNALTLMRTLGVRSEEINIKKAVTQHFEDIGHDPSKLDGTYENSQARERTQVIMDYASRVGGFVVGTGDLSELALGWCTYNGDQMSMYGVNVSIPKTMVRWLIDSIIEYNVFPESTEVLRDILDTPISPELLPPDESGEILQRTESIVGPYELHDFFLYYMMRFGFTPRKIYFLAKKAFAADFDEATILKWLKVFYRRFFSQQFKRSCMPDGVKVGSICLSPRGDWRMPSDACVNAWIKETEEM